jgi:demethylmenaquinone methyltransferase/2-methoxy-6-polyprenyl-1,4-benzoquinol methylase
MERPRRHGDEESAGKLARFFPLRYGPAMQNSVNTETEPESTSPETAEETASFGFRDVRATEKASMVRGVFDSVASKYDVMNDAMSFGMHRLWKSAMIDWLNPRPGMSILDVAGGTGDIALKCMERGADVTVFDINYAMLSEGRDKRFDEGITTGLSWINGDAEALPFADASMDAYTIGFGIRNVTHIPAALKEAHRVLKPGGRFLCLEFSHVVVPGFDAVYDAYSFYLIPHIGQMIAGDADSYRYLVESIRRFPDQETFADMIRDAGFGRVSYRNLSGGIVALHSGWRI